MSLSITLRNSSEEATPPGFTAMALSLSDTAGVAIACRRLASSLLAIAGGVAAGVNTPLHRCTLTSGYPASAMLGTLGNCGERSAPVTASAWTLPASTIGTVGGPSAIAIRHCSVATHSSISLLLFHGIATPGMPVLSLSSSVVIVKAGEVVA